MRKLPSQKKRVETGAVVFGPDWPGVFLRGDSALWHAENLKCVLDAGHALTPMERIYLDQLIKLLDSCNAVPKANPPRMMKR